MEYIHVTSNNARAYYESIAHFLFTHLEEYGDPLADIKLCLDYAFNPDGNGGYAFVAKDEDGIKGAVVINKTGMRSYIPENILVYIAVDATTRGLGVGKKLMEAAMAKAEGAVALHVEPNNPARHLYEKLGFTSKYLEMRYQAPSK